MALRVNGTVGNDLYRDSSFDGPVVNYNGAYTVSFWFTMRSNLVTSGVIWTVADNTFVGYDSVYLGVNGNEVVFESDVGGSGVVETLTVDTTYHFALVRSSSTSLELFIDGVSQGTLTGDVSGRASSVKQYALGLTGSSFPVNAQMFGEKAWSAALTADEIRAEAQTILPRRRSNLVYFHPMIGSTVATAKLDLITNAAEWSPQGTVTVEDNAKGVPWGAPVVLEQPYVFSYSRPASDITTAWTTSSGSNHYALIDETTADDGDYVYATAASQTEEIKLQTVTTPVSGSDLIINYRIQGISGSATVAVSLRSGASTNLKTDTTRTANGDYTMTVTSGEYAGADFTDLRLRFVSG